ncbi:structural protein, partial [Salmonella enterica subsp. enterica]|nr:structural protein [Salmonella enterica subsp. enterica]EEG5547197.1 structural protein [Salmonella enterica subsp. enterica]
MNTPRGIRNNNPGNIRWGDDWKGLVAKSQRTDKSF